MDSAQAWRRLFQAWPASLLQRGVLVTNFSEQVAFSAFWVAEDMLLIERQTPDTVGARKLIIGYDAILAVKLTEVLKPSALAPMGFKT
ncbi:MAG: hypothetical protein WD468_11210 [Pirellulales bacterium]